jgi:hypothetical protein
LGCWLMALVDLLRGTASQTELRFMDGPFWISVQNKAPDRCTMKCIEGPRGRIQYECEHSALALLESTIEAAVRIRRICVQRGWGSRDIDPMERAIVAARSLTVKL